MSNTFFEEKWFVNISLNSINKIFQNDFSDKNKRALEKRFLSNLFWFYIQNSDKNKSDLNELISFFSFAFLNKQFSYSQLLQDLWVLYMTQEQRNGFFVEFGACDGKVLSNTLLLAKKYGWRGILAEPNPIWHENLERRTDSYISKRCVYSYSDLDIEFVATNIPEISRIKEIVPNDIHEKNGNRDNYSIINAKTISLLDLLKEGNAPKIIDYLSIDTEGSEYLILKNFDFNMYKFRLITIEHAGEEEKRKKIYDLLIKNGYKRWFIEVSKWDDWYYLEKGEFNGSL